MKQIIRTIAGFGEYWDMILEVSKRAAKESRAVQGHSKEDKYLDLCSEWFKNFVTTEMGV